MMMVRSALPNVFGGCNGGPTWEIPDERDPRIYGISDDTGRLMVVATYNSDLGDAWEFADSADYPERFSSLAYRKNRDRVIELILLACAGVLSLISNVKKRDPFRVLILLFFGYLVPLALKLKEPSLVAVMDAVPAPTPVTRPLAVATPRIATGGQSAW